MLLKVLKTVFERGDYMGKFPFPKFRRRTKGVPGSALANLGSRYPDYIFKSLPIAMSGCDADSGTLRYDVDHSEKIVTVYL